MASALDAVKEKDLQRLAEARKALKEILAVDLVLDSAAAEEVKSAKDKVEEALTQMREEAAAAWRGFTDDWKKAGSAIRALMHGEGHEDRQSSMDFVKEVSRVGSNLASIISADADSDDNEEAFRATTTCATGFFTIIANICTPSATVDERLAVAVACQAWKSNLEKAHLLEQLGLDVSAMRLMAAKVVTASLSSGDSDGVGTDKVKPLLQKLDLKALLLYFEVKDLELPEASAIFAKSPGDPVDVSRLNKALQLWRASAATAAAEGEAGEGPQLPDNFQCYLQVEVELLRHKKERLEEKLAAANAAAAPFACVTHFFDGFTNEAT